MSSDIHPSAQKVLDGDAQIRERYGVVVTRAQDGDCELHLVVDQDLKLQRVHSVPST